MLQFKKFAPLVKVNEATREIDVLVTSETTDLAKEKCDWETTRPFIVEYSETVRKATEALGVETSLGNVRVMHEKAIGGKFNAVTLDDAAKTWTGTIKVKDGEPWSDVLAGHVTGVSIGGEYMKRWPDPEEPGVTRYTAKISEVSLVDRPCNKDATFLAVRKDGGEEMRKFSPRDDVEQFWDCKIDGCLAKHARKGDAQSCLGQFTKTADSGIRKSLYGMANLIAVLGTLLSITSDEQWEETWDAIEGEAADNTITLQLKALCQRVFDVIEAMIADERAELGESGATLMASVIPGTLKKSKTLKQLIKSLRVHSGNGSSKPTKENEMDDKEIKLVTDTVAASVTKALADYTAAMTKGVEGGVAPKPVVAAPVCNDPSGKHEHEGGVCKADVIDPSMAPVMKAIGTLAADIKTDSAARDAKVTEIESGLATLAKFVERIGKQPLQPQGALRPAAVVVSKAADAAPETEAPPAATTTETKVHKYEDTGFNSSLDLMKTIVSGGLQNIDVPMRESIA